MTTRFVPRLATRPVDPVTRRLRALAALSDDELALLRTLADRRERHATGEQLVGEGQTVVRPRFIVSGWAARQRLMPDGRRQIFAILLPGDGVGLADNASDPAQASVVALTALETVDASPLIEAVDAGRAPGVQHAVGQLGRIEQGLLLDHLVRLGRQTAYERVAHFLMELRERLELVGFGDSQRFPLPLTQEILADALGLSIVHVNRTLQQLRRERLIELRSGIAILLQPDMLGSIADFRRPRTAGRYGTNRSA